MESVCQQPAVLAPVSIWFVVKTLKLVAYSSSKRFHLCLWWLVILYNVFWERQITLVALAGHTVLRAWWRSTRSRTLHDGMCKATTPVAKERCVTSQQRQVGDVTRFWWIFWTYFVVNTLHTKLFSHVIIGIDHGRSGVTATTPSWFVVRRGRTTNHSGVVAVTPSRPWSIP